MLPFLVRRTRLAHLRIALLIKLGGPLIHGHLFLLDRRLAVRDALPTCPKRKPTQLDAQGRMGWMIPTPAGASGFSFTPLRVCYHSAPRSTIRCDCYSLEDSDFHYPRDVIQIR
jgi:hypothetical protein